MHVSVWLFSSSIGYRVVKTCQFWGLWGFSRQLGILGSGSAALSPANDEWTTRIYEPTKKHGAKETTSFGEASRL